MTALSLAYTPLGHEIENSSAALRITRIPVLDRRVFHLRIFLDKLLRQELHTVDSQEESANFPAQVLKKLTGKAKEDGGYDKK